MLQVKKMVQKGLEIKREREIYCQEVTHRKRKANGCDYDAQ